MNEFVQSAVNGGNTGGGISSTQPDQSFESRFNNLERNLELFQENARHMGVIASDFSLQSQEPLNQKVQTLVSGLQVLDQLKNQFVDVRVPIRLLDILDEGNNPQLFTKETLEDTRKRNKELNGKTEIYKKFQYNLIRELKMEMSSDIDEYLRVRKLINGGNVSQVEDSCSTRNLAKDELLYFVEIDFENFISKKEKMNRIMTYFAPRNSFIAERIRFGENFREMKVCWTAFTPMSEGTEKFVENYLPIIRQNNPQIKFSLQRGYVNVDPWLVGIFEFERKRIHRLCWKEPSQILAMVEQFAEGGDYRSSYRCKVNKILPRGLQLWDCETKGHDVFTIYSKWKSDPIDKENINLTSSTHPHFCYRGVRTHRKRSIKAPKQYIK
ncbi:L51_S25_CI-B8 domain-containing protein [Meloidogyne graminicola]|uniref:Mediator of RNA polymerase II transcription subunit 10 n=1 Tax=Meloidogyne graminicola TaxID=189291 RepID=A0A8S9ZKY4_9BILA|nr:L51_S25_CI-B8 domain-containing protein [Meloidogyne graminicola]